MRARGLLAVAACVALAGAAVATAGPDVRQKPKLVLATAPEPVVRGTGFKPRERVTVRLTVGSRTFTARLRATRAGAFAARFREAALTECEPVSAVAVGSGGSRATLARKFEIPPPCGIAPQP